MRWCRTRRVESDFKAHLHYELAVPKEVFLKNISWYVGWDREKWYGMTDNTVIVFVHPDAFNSYCVEYDSIGGVNRLYGTLREMWLNMQWHLYMPPRIQCAGDVPAILKEMLERLGVVLCSEPQICGSNIKS
jgi:hypothetical protein